MNDLTWGCSIKNSAAAAMAAGEAVCTTTAFDPTANRSASPRAASGCEVLSGCATYSPMPPTAKVTSGRPMLMASMLDMQKVSPMSDGFTTMCRRRSSAGSAAGATIPANSTAE